MIALQHAGTVDEVYTVGNTRSLPRVFDIEGLQQETLSQVECGEDFSLALTDAGEVYAWGDANYGKLAALASADMPTDDDNLPYQPLPVLIRGFNGCRLVQLACGSNHSLALTEGGRVWAWGGAIFGRLGPSDITSMPLDEDGDPFQPTPVLVEGFGDARVRRPPRRERTRRGRAPDPGRARALAEGGAARGGRR
jgi:alpha-tubulin suppressor-like RCC1 family protein